MNARGHSTSTSGKDYVLHIDDPRNPGKVWCKRIAANVNRGGGTESEDMCCRVCWRGRKAAAGQYDGHAVERLWSIGATPMEAIMAFCLARVGAPLEGLPTALDEGDPRFTWGRRFVCDGTSMKAAGIDVPGGVALTWWK